MSLKAQFQIGQQLWWVSQNWRSDYDARGQVAKVVKIGTKWVTIQTKFGPALQYTIDREIGADLLGRPDNCGNRSGRAYLSREVYEAQIALSGAWTKLCREFSSLTSHHPDVTLEDIQQVRALLRLDGKPG